MNTTDLKKYYEKEGTHFTLNDYYIGIYQMYSTHACRIAIIKKWLKYINRGTFCEVGCGFGYFAHLIAKRGIKCTGVDISKNKIKIAQKIADKNKLDCNFYVMNIQNLKFNDNTFNWVLSSQVLEHIPDDMKAISELYRITKSFTIITVPKRGFFWNFLDSTSQIRSFNKPGHGHFREYSDSEIINKLKQVGFKILKIEHAGFISPRMDLLFRKIPFMQAITCLLLKK
ncbi:MAG: class I SAM-dependent methyltransferase [Candidatus Helarchaeota archaeon]